MPSRTRYLFDSDVLITSNRIHYNPAYCEAFWAWLVAGYKAGIFYSIDKVRNELLNGDKKDPLHKWAHSPELSGFFKNSLPALPKWAYLSEGANSPEKNYTEPAKTKFLNVDAADAWLIATAAHEGNFVIVTNEVSAPLSKTIIKLPDAAAWLSVKTAKLVDVLQKHAGCNFSFKNSEVMFTADALPPVAVASAAGR